MCLLKQLHKSLKSRLRKTKELDQKELEFIYEAWKAGGLLNIKALKNMSAQCLIGTCITNDIEITFKYKPTIF